MIRRPPRSTRTDTLFPYTTLFRSLVGFAPQVANRNFRVLALAPGNLGQVAPPFFRKRRHGYANIVAHGYGIGAKVGFADGFLDRAGHIFFPDLDAKRTRIDQRKVGDLADRHRGTVILDLKVE